MLLEKFKKDNDFKVEFGKIAADRNNEDDTYIYDVALGAERLGAFEGAVHIMAIGLAVVYVSLLWESYGDKIKEETGNLINKIKGKFKK